MKNPGIYKIDPIDGSIVFKCDPSIAQFSGFGGLTFDGTSVWHADAYGGKIYKLNPIDCSIIESIPFNEDQYPSDLAWDGANLWLSSYPAQKIYEINPSDGSIIREYEIPYIQEQAQTTGLTYDGAYLRMSGSDKIFVIDPSNGKLVSQTPHSISRAGGLAWGENLFWIASFSEGIIYRLEE
jgi:streptogramin lyase